MSSESEPRLELEAEELRQASFHVASQLVLLLQFGGLGDARVWRNPSGAEDERAWVGRVRAHAPPGSRPGSAPAPKNWHALFGLAGELGSMLSEEPQLEAADAGRRLEVLVEQGIVSDHDAQLIGAIDALDVAQCLGQLRAHWPEIEREARSLKRFAQA